MNHPNGYYYFSGKDLIRAKSTFPHTRNHFTYEFWAKPEASHRIDRESRTGVDGVGGKRYAISPEHGATPDEAGTGISVGVNGVSVYEHTFNHMPAILVYPGRISGWTHIAVVFRDRRPYLYLNGVFVKAGVQSSKARLAPCGMFGGHVYGYYVGGLADIKVWGYARTEAEIRKSMSQSSAGSDPRLIGHWTLGDGNGIVESDSSRYGTAAVVLGAAWNAGRPLPHGRIGIMISSSQYDATRYFAFDMASAFLRLGYRAVLIDLSRTDGPAKLKELMQQPDLRFLIGMNGHGIDQLRGSLLSGGLRVPFLSYFVDHPMFHLQRFDFHGNMPGLLVSCVDLEHLRYLKQYFRGSFATVFAPQAAMNPPAYYEKKSIKDRTIDILFAGTNLNPDQFRRGWAGDPHYGRILDEIAERTLYQFKHSLIDIARQTFQRHGKPFPHPNDARLSWLLQQADLYVRGRRRLEILASLSELPVTVYTNHTDNLPKKGRIRYLPPVNLKKFQSAMYDSKMVLNVLANLVYGAHERIFTAMQAGAVSLTDRNQYLSKHFRHRHNIVFVDYQRKNLSSEIGAMLQRPDLLQAIANEALKSVPSHTWHARAVNLLRAVQKHSIR
ncbi:glycosyltransferase family protein [Cohnella hongkongensis]|uniref:Glycosyltransferase n=1 Tax=Cohnella hongkongensis TaxID=178337 RepID=A0ABV9FKR7_9BACL